MAQLSVVLDCSASMGAWGKYDISKLCLRRVIPIARKFGMEAALFAWRTDVVPAQKLSEFLPDGTSEGEALVAFLEESEGAVLLLSDGLWRDDAKVLRHAAGGRALAVVTYGADRNPSRPEELATCGCWTVEDLVAAVQRLAGATADGEAAS